MKISAYDNEEKQMMDSKNQILNFDSTYSYLISPNPSMSLNFNINGYKTKKKGSLNPLYDQSNILTSVQMKELEELSQCSFNPKINKNSDLLQKAAHEEASPFIRLHKESFSRQERKQELAIKQIGKENLSHSFSPDLIRSKSSNNIKDKSKSKSNSCSFNKNEFIKNLYHLEEIKRKKMNDLILKTQKKFDTEYSFKPRMVSNNNLYLNHNINIIPRHIKLFEDSKLIEERLKNKTIEYHQKIFKGFKKSKSCSNLSGSFMVKSDHFKKLYDDMKIYKEKKLDLINTHYKKYSFVPRINSNIKVNSSFDERNLLINFSPVKSEIIKKIKKNITKHLVDKKSNTNVESSSEKASGKIREKSMNKMKNEDLLKDLKKKHNIKFKRGKLKEKIQKVHTMSEDQELNENKTVVNDKEHIGNDNSINDLHIVKQNKETKYIEKIKDSGNEDINNLCPPSNINDINI